MLGILKKSKNLIINIVLLTITAGLLIATMMAWYISNKEVSASGISASTDDGLFTLELERGTYADDTWSWTPTSSLSISNMQPNDTFFFRFKITARSEGSLRVKLSGISSNLQEDSVTLSNDNISVLVNGAKCYELDNNNRVMINSQILYTYANSSFSLGYYLVQNTFKYYDYEIGTSSFEYDDNVLNSPNAGVQLLDISATYNVSDAGIFYGYFALEFNDQLSLVNYQHIDGITKEDSNLYQSQILAIKQISVETIL